MGGLDESLLLWVVEHRVGALDPLFIGLSLLGTAGLVWVALSPLAASLAGRPPVRGLVYTAAAVWGSDLTAQGLKLLVDRPRPSLALPQIDPLVGGTIGSSFPSGHAATSTAGAICLSLLFRRAWPAFVGLAAGVALSRIYVGVHYPGDVIAGLAIGAAFATAVTMLSRRLRGQPAGPDRGGRRRTRPVGREP